MLPEDIQEAVRAASHARRFVLYRLEDESGVSSKYISRESAVVAEGCLWTSGRVSLTWLSPLITVAAYDSMEVVEKLHGHGGKTLIFWIDG